MLPTSFPTGGSSGFPRVCGCAKCAGLSAEAIEGLSPDHLPPAVDAALASLPPQFAAALLAAIEQRLEPALALAAPDPVLPQAAPVAASAVEGAINPGTSGAPTGNIYVDGLVWGGSWTPELGTGVTLTWAPVTRAAVGLGGGNANGLTPTATELDAIREGLALWAEVADITFVEMPLNTPDTDLSYMVVSNFQMLLLTLIPGVLGFHQVPDGSDPGPLTGVFNRGGLGFNAAGLEQGGFGFITVVHEIGHGLGLAHPHDGGGDGQIFPGVSSSSDPGDNALNQGIWTTMSYVDGWETQFPAHSELGYGYQAGPMSLDIAAIQTIYGANTTTRTGDDVYLLPTANGPGSFWLSLWDAGGVDAISAAGAAGAAVIDLREAPLTGAEAGGYVSWVQGVVGGRTIAHGALIENAAGGDGNDTITGNDSGNLIDGGAGADSMAGGLGDDTYVVDQAGDVIAEAVGGGTDTVLAGIAFTLGAELENLVLTGTAAIGGTGNGLANLLTGNDAANLLDGAAGADSMAGGLGDDTYAVDQAGDVVTELAGGGTDTVLSAISFALGAELENLALTGAAAIDGLGNGLANRLTGNGAANRLSGGLGNDTLDGNGGADSLTGGAGADQFLFDVLTTGFATADRVVDFLVGTDLLVLDSAVFTALGGPGALDAEAFTIGNAASEADDRVIYSVGTGWFGYDADGTGAGAGVVLANIGAGRALTEASFLII